MLSGRCLAVASGGKGSCGQPQKVKPARAPAWMGRRLKGPIPSRGAVGTCWLLGGERVSFLWVCGHV